jgi:hypothetical protein
MAKYSIWRWKYFGRLAVARALDRPRAATIFCQRMIRKNVRFSEKIMREE